MKVEINREPKLSKTDHLFALVAEKPRRTDAYPSAVRKAIDDSGFEGRADQSITILSAEPKKITLIGVGKEDAVTIRVLRQGLLTAAKIARKHRDTNIAVVAPFAGISTRVVADYLAAS